MAKKRSNGEGYVRKLNSGRWACTFMDGYKDDGRKKMVTLTGDTKTEVLDLVRDYKNNKDKGVQVNKSMTFSDWADTWYKDYESQVAASTYAGYRYTLNILENYFKDRPLDKMLPIHINGFFDFLVKKDYSHSAISKCRAMLIQIFDAAEANMLIGFNPARKAKLVKGSEDTESRKDAFTDEEVEQIIKHHKDDLMGNSMCFLVGTGVRVQELLALTPECIAADGSTVKIEHAIKMVNGIPVLGPPKSKKGKRTVPIPEDYRQYALYLRNHGGKEFIWSSNRNDHLYSVGTFRRQYYAALKSVPGVRKLSPHCCRHTYVTSLQAKGVPMETIAKLVGHGSIEVTDNYLHTRLDTLADAVSVLNATEDVASAS